MVKEWGFPQTTLLWFGSLLLSGFVLQLCFGPLYRQGRLRCTGQIVFDYSEMSPLKIAWRLP